MVRTDLALEMHGRLQKNPASLHGIQVVTEEETDGITIRTVTIETENAAKAMGKPKGMYITIEFTNNLAKPSFRKQVISITAKKLKNLLPLSYEKDAFHLGMTEESNLSVLVVGLGNRNVEIDALGPKVIDKIYMSRHIMKEFGKNVFASEEISCISGIAPGVIAETGMEAGEIVAGIVRETEPDFVITIDALVGRSTKRIGTTIQLTNTGIVPGGGVGMHKKAISQEKIGIPVISIGVPTVIDASYGFFLTPKNLSEIVEDMSGVIARVIEKAVYGSMIK